MLPANSLALRLCVSMSGPLFLLLFNSLAVERACADRTNDAFNSGLRLYNHRDYRGAIKYFDECISRNQKFAQAYCQRGHANFILGNHSSALADLNTAIAINPKMPTAYVYRAITFNELGQQKRAIDDCSKSISLDSKAGDAYVLRAKLYRAGGHVKEGIDDMTKAIGLQPKVSDYHFERANMYLALRQYEQAAQDYTVVINNRSSSEIEKAYANRARCYDKMGRHDLALKDLQKLNQETEEGWGSFVK